MSTLILKGVTKQFGDFYAARDISLTAEEGICHFARAEWLWKNHFIKNDKWLSPTR